MSEVDMRMIKGRSLLIMLHAFFGALAMRLHVKELAAVETMATDGKSLYYCRAFLDRISEDELLFVIAHEVLHCALGHTTRRGGRDPYLWNIACDHVVNLMLLSAGFKSMPKGGYADPAYKGMSAEQVYSILEKQQQAQRSNQCQVSQSSAGTKADGTSKQNGGTSTTTVGTDVPQEPGSGSTPKPQDGDPSESSGGTSTPDSAKGQPAAPTLPGDPGGCGAVLDAAPAYDEAALEEAADEWRVYVRQAASIAKRQGQGKLPGFIEEILDTLQAARVNWREVLRRFADPSDTKDYTWRTPNRRNVSMGYITPGVISDGVNHLGIAVDSSYSIDTEMLTMFMSEAQGLLHEGAVDKVTLLFVDTRVTAVREYQKGDIIDITVPGRGGTDFAPAFEWFNEHAPDISGMIYFTDLECDTYGPTPTYPVLWAAYGNPRSLKRYMKGVPFGECMELVK